MNIQGLFQELRDDHVLGSSELLRKVTDWLLVALDSGEDSDDLLNQLRLLCAEHPSMVLLQNFDAFFQKISLNANRIKAWLEMYQKHEAASCRYLANHLSIFNNILVHSNSGMLTTAFEMTETPLNIFCTEGRPAYEGRWMAEKLSRTKHKIFLISDLAAFSVLPRVEMLAFGCDAITPRGFVNKVGTCPLATAAMSAGKKNYFVATTEKYVDHWSEDFLLRKGPREEIYSGTEPIQVENYYFDLTPPDRANGVFLETGLKDCAHL